MLSVRESNLTLLCGLYRGQNINYFAPVMYCKCFFFIIIIIIIIIINFVGRRGKFNNRGKGYKNEWDSRWFFQEIQKTSKLTMKSFPWIILKAKGWAGFCLLFLFQIQFGARKYMHDKILCETPVNDIYDINVATLFESTKLTQFSCSEQHAEFWKLSYNISYSSKISCMPLSIWPNISFPPPPPSPCCCCKISHILTHLSLDHLPCLWPHVSSCLVMSCLINSNKSIVLNNSYSILRMSMKLERT